MESDEILCYSCFQMLACADKIRHRQRIFEECLIEACIAQLDKDIEKQNIFKL